MGPEQTNKLLKEAIKYAARGWPIFPCHRLDEEPEAFQQRLTQTAEAKRKELKPYKAKSPYVLGGCYAATSDQQQVTAWWTRWPDAMIGLATGPRSGVWVLDIDLPDGMASLAALEESNSPLPDTVEQRTGSGGRQLFFTWPTDGRYIGTSVATLGKNLDVRGNGGYVIIPPSPHPCGDEYTWVKTPKRGTKFSAAPDWLVDLSKKTPPKAKEDKTEAVIDLDQDWNIMDSVAYLQETAPPSIEGYGGNDNAFKVAAVLRDKGVSELTGLELMLRVWNDRCEPPWEAEELGVIVNNAYHYAHHCAPGGMTAEAAFAPCWTPPEEAVLPTTPEDVRPGWITYDEFEARMEASKGRGPLAHSVADIDPEGIPNRDWIMKGRFIPQFVTVTVAPGGGSKSTLSTLEAIAVATGKNLTGMEVIKSGGVWLYNAEDPTDELERKFVAACIHHGLDPRTLGNLFYRSGQDEKALVFVKNDPTHGLMVHQAVVDAMIKYIRDHGIVLLILDPFVRTHRVNENDNMQIDSVVAVLSRIANVTHCAIHIVHHTRKRGNEGGQGDMDTARGASSNVSAARVVHTLNTMTEKEAKEYGIPQDQASFYVRMDDAKANFIAPTRGTVWFKRAGIKLAGGTDDIGVLRHVELGKIEKVTEDLTQGADELMRAIAGFVAPGTSKSLNAVVEFILAEGSALPFLGAKTPSRPTLMRRLEEWYLREPVVIDGVVLSFSSETAGAYNRRTIACELGTRKPEKAQTEVVS